MSLDMERLIPVNFATVEDLQRIPHVGPKVACAIITLQESHGNLTLDTLQTFLRVQFNAETLEMLDFTCNVGLPVLQLPHEQFDFEGGEEAGLEERQRPISPAPSVFKDPFEMKPRTSVKAEAVEERQPSIAEGWETVRQKFVPMPSMPEHKLTLPTAPSQIRERQTPLDYKVLRPAKLAEELGQKSKKKEGKRSKSRHRGKGARHKNRGHRDSSASSLSQSYRSAKKEEKLRKLEKSRRYDKKTSHKKRVQLNSSSSSSSEESKYHKKGAKPKKKLVQDKYSSSLGSSSSSSDTDSDDEIRAKHLSHHMKSGKGSSSDSSSSDTDSDDEIRAKHRSHHRKSKKGRSSSSTDTDDEYNIREKHRSHHKRSKKRGRTALLRLLPKNLSYDGKTNWLAFKQRFTGYATACEWTSEECLNCLCWCLTDKAADFYAILMERNEHLMYRRLMCRLEKRFGIKELAETAQARFRQATQASGESLEDWADRILTLATKAFKMLPEHYSSKQAVIRFCEGLLDREAGLHVGMDKPANMEQAINSIRWYQHLQQSVYGKSNKQDQRKQEEVYVKAAQETRVQNESLDEQSSSRISALEAAMTRLQESFDALSSKMS